MLVVLPPNRKLCLPEDYARYQPGADKFSLIFSLSLETWLEIGRLFGFSTYTLPLQLRYLHVYWNENFIGSLRISFHVYLCLSLLWMDYRLWIIGVRSDFPSKSNGRWRIMCCCLYWGFRKVIHRPKLYAFIERFS